MRIVVIYMLPQRCYVLLDVFKVCLLNEWPFHHSVSSVAVYWEDSYVSDGLLVCEVYKKADVTGNLESV